MGYESLGPVFNPRHNLNKDTYISPELNHGVSHISGTRVSVTRP